MQSAFVDIGLERDAFLYVSDFFEDNEEYDAVVSTVEEKVLKMEKGGGAVEREKPAAVSVVEAPTVEAEPAAEQRPDGNRDGRPDRGGDRGGRGRRGRRRRGGRGSGLPESKFFSPGAEPAAETAPEPEPDTRVEAEPNHRPAFEKAAFERTPATADDFTVLPGESLAKYAPEGAPEQEPAVAVEPTLPEEHPLAGFGAVTSWVTPSGSRSP